MKCQSNNCRNDAIWHRPKEIHGCANALCNGCMIRIYSAFPHHASAWEKLPPETNTPQSAPPTPTPPEETQSLFCL